MGSSLRARAHGIEAMGSTLWDGAWDGMAPLRLVGPRVQWIPAGEASPPVAVAVPADIVRVNYGATETICRSHRFEF